MKKYSPWDMLTSIQVRTEEKNPVRELNETETVELIKILIKKCEEELSELNFDIKIVFENTGGHYFWDDTAPTGFHGPNHKMIINLDWYLFADDYEIIHAIWHETYHLYQWSQIEKMRLKQMLSEESDKISRWQKQMAHYIKKSVPTEIPHLKQELEADAYTFSLYMLLKYFPEDSENIEIGIPKEIKAGFMQKARALFYQKQLESAISE